MVEVGARNRFRGKVIAITPGGVNAEVVVELSGGDRLVAVVALAGVHELGIAPGKEVVALVKAPWVMVLTEPRPAELSARNRLKGTVRRVSAGAVNAEVDIELPGGEVVVAVVTRAAAIELALEPGVAATAVIKASDVVLGVPGAR